MPAEIKAGERGQCVVVAAVDESGLAERRSAFQAQRHLLVIDHLVTEPARQVPARIISQDPVMFPAAEAKGEGAFVDPVLRLQLGQIAFDRRLRSEEHTSELQSLMRKSYAVFCLKQKKQ